MILSYPSGFATLAGLALLAQLASASDTPLPILEDFDATGVLGGLYRPNTTSPRSHIGIYIMHAEQDYASFVGCTELQERGFTVFCANNEASKSGYMSDINFEDMMLQANTGLAWLRNQTDIDKVVILGHSGGDFKKRFTKGIVARNNRVLEHAQHRLKEIEKGNGMFGDDEPLTIPAALYLATNNLYISQDVRTLHHTTYPCILLEKTGTTEQIIQSVRVPSGWVDVSNFWEQAALKTTIRRYLSTLAIRANENFDILADNFEGIEYDSTQMAPAASIKGISVPLLTVGMTGHYEYLNAEKIHLNVVKSNDTSIAFVQGAQHGIYPCTECESYSGELGDTVKTCFNCVAGWLSEQGRFL